MSERRRVRQKMTCCIELPRAGGVGVGDMGEERWR